MSTNKPSSVQLPTSSAGPTPRGRNISISDTHGATPLVESSAVQLPMPAGARDRDIEALRSLERCGVLAAATTDNQPGADARRDLRFITALYDEAARGAILYYIDATAERASLLAAHGEVMATLAQASREQVARSLAECWALCKRRNEDEDDTALTLGALIDRIKVYPGDIVLEALAEWPNKNKFTPSWAELREILDSKAKHRKRIATTLKLLLAER